MIFLKEKFNMYGEMSVNAGEKLNPFGLLVMGTSGFTKSSLDKMLIKLR